ncbi:MAG: FIVAR domain-containing protein [Firmicutes bacterium]|nr:FIVAR domain-containing protein [Bacillota bacterium]
MKGTKKIIAFALVCALIAVVLTACNTETTDKTALQAAITSAETIKATADYGDYTKPSRTAFESALDNAKAANSKADAKQSEIDAAKNTLIAAQNNLTIIPEDKTALASAISDAQAIIDDANYTTDYSELARGAFELVLAASTEVYENENATQPQIDGAASALLAAITLLTENG